MEKDRGQIHKNRARLGKLLLEFEGRILGGIRLDIDKSSGNPSRYTYRFVKVNGEPPTSKPAETTDVSVAPADTVAPTKSALKASQAPEIAAEAPENCNPVTLCNPFHACSLHAREKQITHDTHTHLACAHVNGGSSEKGYRGLQGYRLEEAAAASFLALDLETFAGAGLRGGKASKITSSPGALSPWGGSIRLVTVADEAGNTQQFDLLSGPLPEAFCERLKRTPLIVHNAAFDLLFLNVLLGIQSRKVFCTLTASWLLAPSHKISHELAAVLERYLGVKIVKGLGSSDWGSLILTAAQIAYACNDVRYLHQLKEVLETELGRAGLDRVFELESALLPMVVDIEKHGFAVDLKKMRGLLAQAEARQNELQEALRTAFKIPALNPGSSSQVVKAFQSIGITVPNAKEETLLPLDHECASMVVEQHKAKKRVSTIEGLLKRVHADGRIHAQFKPLGTITGRFSSSKPNLQNIDRGELRTCFIPSAPDRRLIVADYSQIELRIGAIFASDTVMLDAFRAGEDLHRKTAADVLSKSVADVTKDDRQLAKAINFGFLYGQQAEGFRAYAKTHYGVTVSSKDAIKFRSRFFEQRLGLRRWHQAAWSKVPKVTEARTILGRVVLPRNNTDWEKFQLLTNYITQGSAADVLKVAMVKLRYRLPALIVVATVHDELVFDVPAEGAEALCELIRLTMIDAFSEVFGDIIPMEVEAKVCFNWGEKG